MSSQETPPPGSGERDWAKMRIMWRLCESLTELGTDPRIQTACVVVPADFSRVLGIGYNGAPAGVDHAAFAEMASSDVLLERASGMAHAELNALVKMDTASSPPCLMMTTVFPCPTCASHVVNSGVVAAVVFKGFYDSDRHGRASWILKQSGVVTRSSSRLFLDSGELERPTPSALFDVRDTLRRVRAWRRRWTR